MIQYPFSPAILDAMPEELAELFRGLEDTLLKDICERLKNADSINEVSVQDIRALRSHGISLDEIKKAIQTVTNTGAETLNALLQDVVDRNQEYYTELVDLAGITQPETMVDIQTIEAIRKQTKDEYRNITRSMGFLVDNGRTKLEPAKAYQWALDSAELQVQSGAVSYNQAISKAVKQLADSGLKTVSYESGHVDQVDVAVRRAVMTGTNQLCQQYANDSIDYLETDLVQVSAHYGARNTGTGPENHESWQGGIYRWGEKEQTSEGDYPDFVETTGYGTGPGLGGWNCRHHFSPYVEDVSQRTYTDDELEAMKGENNKITFEGREYDGYQATQKQREIERTIRKQKREVNAFKAAGLDDEAEAANIKLQRLNDKYTAFSKAAGLKRQLERLKIEY